MMALHGRPSACHWTPINQWVRLRETGCGSSWGARALWAPPAPAPAAPEPPSSIFTDMNGTAPVQQTCPEQITSTIHPGWRGSHASCMCARKQVHVDPKSWCTDDTNPQVSCHREEFWSSWQLHKFNLRSILFEYLSHYPASELTAEDQTKWLSSRVNVFFEVAALLFIPLSQNSPESNLNSASSLNLRAEKGLTFGSHSLASICVTECCSSAVLGGGSGGGESASSRQSLHSRTDNSTAGANASARVCLCVCWRQRDSCRLHSLTLCFSFPSLAPFLLPVLWFLSPFPPLHFLFSHLLCSPWVSRSVSPPPALSPPSLSAFSSFPSRASLVAVDVTEAEAEATLPLIGCHSQVTDKEKKEGGGGEPCPCIPVSISWDRNRETGGLRGWRRGRTVWLHESSSLTDPAWDVWCPKPVSCLFFSQTSRIKEMKA